MIEVERPDGIRKGQQLFNFLFWLQHSKHIDPYYLGDEELDSLYAEYLKECDVVE